MPTDAPVWDETISEQEYKANRTPSWEESKPAPEWDNTISEEEYKANSKPSFLSSAMSALATGMGAVRDAQQRENTGLSKPLITVSPETILKFSPAIAALDPETVAGVAKGISGLVSGMTSPESLGVIAAAAVAPEVVGGVLAGLGAKSAGEKSAQAIEAWRAGKKEEAGQLWTEAGAGALQAIAAPVGAGLEMAAPVKAPPIIEAAERVGLTRSADAIRQLENTSETKTVNGPAIEPTDPSLIKPEETPAVPPRTATQNVQALGIVPPGAQMLSEAATTAVDSAKEAAGRLDKIRQGFSNLLKSSDTHSEIVRKLDAADNEAKIEGEQIGNSVRLDIPSKADREAVTFIVEANGDQSKLAEFEAKIGDNNPAALSAVRLAQRDWERLSPGAEKVNQLHGEQLQYEQENGIDPGNVEGYVRHAYDMDAMIGKGRPVLLSNPKGGSGVATSFKKQRTFQTYADAIEAGFKPRTFDVADLVQSRITIGERLVNRQKWAQHLASIPDPIEGRPIVTAMVTQPKGTQVAPMGYESIQIMPGHTVAVHEGYSDLISGLTGKSRFQAWMPTRIALNTEGFIKHGLLMLDTFHAARMLYKELALTGGIKHDLGGSLLEYRDADLVKAVNEGEITQEAADWARQSRPDAELLTSNGLNVGRVSDALYKDTVKRIPIVGDFTRWTFDKLTRGAMMQSAIQELGRLRNLLPDKTESELAAIVSKNINTYYGNLGRQGFLSDPTLQDLARLVALAPQWVEGMARTEAGAVKQAVKAPIDAAQGEPFVMGTLAKGVGTGVLSVLIANQLINLATRGHPTWQNDEHGHQLDAFIPDPTGKSPGFWLNPLSVFAELSHDALRYYSTDPHALEVAMKMAGNKRSPLLSSASVLATGYDWMGNYYKDSWERIKAAGSALVPAPIPLRSELPFIGKNAPPGSLERQIFSSLGIKVEPAQSAESQLYTLAHQFEESKGIRQQPSAPSEYRDLNVLLRKEDWKAAFEEYRKLTESKGESTVTSHYSTMTKRLFTGKRSTESDFQQSLTPQQQTLFEKAKDERQELKDKFFEMLQKGQP